MAQKFGSLLINIIEIATVFLLANFPTLSHMGISLILLCLLIPLFLVINVIPNVFHFKLLSRKLQNSADGCTLLILFLVTTSASVIYSLIGWFGKLPLGNLLQKPGLWGLNSLIIFLVELLVFWNGIIRIYLTSQQLGIKLRVIGAVCGMIPVLNLVVLGILLRTVMKEVRVENDKLLLNKEREGMQICRTKYPILLVHGVFFRDSNFFNYWGRIPKELEKNGAVIYYGNHQSAASVEDSAHELAERITQIIKENGCEKVNIIAHSKGGLDCRYAIAKLGIKSYVASLTTVNTPHRGCEFADYLLSRIPKKQQDMVANTYNSALKKFGDIHPDFLAAVNDLTASACQKLNEEIKDAPNVYYQSIGSKLNVASSGRFPLNFSYRLVQYFDGANDGLVGEKSFPWGQNFQLLTVQGKRGISHGDVIDLNRENFDGFDAREFYVQLVSELSKKGY